MMRAISSNGRVGESFGVWVSMVCAFVCIEMFGSMRLRFRSIPWYLFWSVIMIASLSLNKGSILENGSFASMVITSGLRISCAKTISITSVQDRKRCYKCLLQDITEGNRGRSAVM